MRDVIIVGGGASGLVAALILARQKKQVTLLEHNEKIGRKILATGNGKCNFTNQYQTKSCYRGENPNFAWNLIQQCGMEDYVSFMYSIGIAAKQKNGYYYPYSEQASSIVEALLLELSYRKVKIKCKEHVTDIMPADGGYIVSTKTYNYQAKKVILACGGQAAPILGSDGSGYELARKLGHSITPLFPALVALKVADKNMQKLAGIRIKAEIHLIISDKDVACEFGEIQFTASGISGIPVFQISRYATHAIIKGEKAVAILTFLPDFTNDTLMEYFKNQAAINGYKSILQTLQNLMDRKLAEVILDELGVGKTKAISECKILELEHLATKIKGFQLPIRGMNGYEQAQVTAGGINTNEICETTLESVYHKGVYFTGELVDVDGTCGGYNLQWAFTSASVAATHAAK
ncbi:MAG: NAD(P)/FAD-dependent oxidoreductase [Velocimicrobium sp.]